jgi:alpha-D-ribose 1-methylphosphonate 5-triphosphate synthase subunit PhnI
MVVLDAPALALFRAYGASTPVNGEFRETEVNVVIVENAVGMYLFGYASYGVEVGREILIGQLVERLMYVFVVVG